MGWEKALQNTCLCYRGLKSVFHRAELFNFNAAQFADRLPMGLPKPSLLYPSTDLFLMTKNFYLSSQLQI